MITIAVDLMGSDLGYKELTPSVVSYLNSHKDAKVILFGDENEIRPLLKDVDSSRYEVVNATEVIPMEIKPLDFLRMKQSSMYMAIDCVRQQKADAVLSAGSSGGFITGASMLLRNIEGVSRSGLCSPFPTAVKNKATVILDIGANNVNTPEDLYGFARMGRIYCQNILSIPSPKTYLLSNGVEEGKGTDEIVGAYKLLKERNFPDFCGNCEAREVLDGSHDVIVTPGFSGNILLKATEGTASLMNGLIKKAFKTSLLTKVGYLFSKKGFADMKDTMNYRQYGGAILLGVNGVCIKAHGNSNTYAFKMALEVSDKMVRSKIVDKIKEEFQQK